MFFCKSLSSLLECKNFNSNGYFFNILAHETKTFKAPFKASDVHEQCGISFRTPPFPEQDINSQILVSCIKEKTYYVQHLLKIIYSEKATKF
jgi:hypothetical protein